MDPNPTNGYDVDYRESFQSTCTNRFEFLLFPFFSPDREKYIRVIYLKPGKIFPFLLPSIYRRVSRRRWRNLFNAKFIDGKCELAF